MDLFSRFYGLGAIVTAVILAVFSSYAYIYFGRTARMIGLGRSVTSTNITSCRQIGHDVLHGCEDIIVDPHTGLAYLACGSLKPRQRWLNPDDKYDFASEAEKDRIYVMDEADEYSEIKALEMTSEGELQPYSQDLRVHGFDIYWDPQDQDDMTFMIVNHQLEHAAISIFSHRRGSDYMTHVETVRSSLLQSPNDVVAVSKREFYATNDMKYYKGPLREISLYLRLANGHLVHRNEDGVFSIAANSIAYPNGIAMNGDLIYVASCTDPSIQVYRRHKNGSLDYQGRTFYWDTIPDNLHVDPSTRQIYSTTFTKHAETHKYFKSPSLNTTTTAGTKLLRFTPRSGSVHEFDVENLLIDSGTLVPTATIAVVQRRNSIERLLMGCVMCNFIVACDDVI